MTLTKSEIVDGITDGIGVSRKMGVQTLETLLEIMKKNLQNGEDVLVSGFGKFCIKGKEPRRGRNPSTGEDMTLPERKVVVFRCSHILREKINGG
jgi:integration host factor subunit alpha